ncbi:hypothetical protein ACJDU8_06540 [Clostridium sp. WILCCON 0269]|uniref:Uncharacterized protein n=1 Tax=Candidatus Clostridium eludens TaxID=3381663 RepID=A0ABW8SH70_9CLOT
MPLIFFYHINNVVFLKHDKRLTIAFDLDTPDEIIVKEDGRSYNIQ